MHYRRFCRGSESPRRDSSAKRFRTVGKSITDPVHCLDLVEVSVDRSEFSAQPLYVAVDAALVDRHLILGNEIPQCVAASHRAWADSQALHQSEFGCSQVQLPVFPHAGVTLAVHAQVTALDHIFSNVAICLRLD